MTEVASRTGCPSYSPAGAGAHFSMAAGCARSVGWPEAFEHLENLGASRLPRAPLNLSNPLLAPLRSNPRFAEIRRKRGLASVRVVFDASGKTRNLDRVAVSHRFTRKEEGDAPA